MTSSMITTWNFEIPELLQAVMFSEIRTAASKGRKDNWGLVNNDPIVDARRQLVGTLGEWAVASAFGRKYRFSVNTFKAPDVIINGWPLQVKGSEYAKNLIIRPDAKDLEPYILTHVVFPEGDPRLWTEHSDVYAIVHILGWHFPFDARRAARRDPSMRRDPGGRKAPAIFLQRDMLRPMTELHEYVQKPYTQTEGFTCLYYGEEYAEQNIDRGY